MVHLLRWAGWRQLVTIQACSTTAELEQLINWCLSLPSARGNVKSRQIWKHLSSTLQDFFGKGWPQPINSVCWIWQRQSGFCRELQRGPTSSASLNTFPFVNSPASGNDAICSCFGYQPANKQPLKIMASWGVMAVSHQSNRKRQDYTQRSKFIHVTLFPLEGLHRGATQIQQTYRRHTFTQHDYKPNKTPFTTFCTSSVVQWLRKPHPPPCCLTAEEGPSEALHTGELLQVVHYWVEL